MIMLGSKVKDVVSGFEGIAVAEYNFLYGCSRYCVQPSMDKDGKLPDNQTFDEPQLKVVSKPSVEMTKSLDGVLNTKPKTKTKTKAKPKRPGGPSPYKPKPRRM